jgi:hypothetical protein
MRAFLEISPTAQPRLNLSAPSLAEVKLLWDPRAPAIFETQPEVPDLSMLPNSIVLWHPLCFW